MIVWVTKAAIVVWWFFAVFLMEDCVTGTILWAITIFPTLLVAAHFGLFR